jgi:hypothetical protein
MSSAEHAGLSKLDALLRDAAAMTHAQTTGGAASSAGANNNSTKGGRKPSAGSRGRKGRNRMKEDEEDKQLLADAETDARPAFVDLKVQPTLINKSVGTMRDYQVAALNVGSTHCSLLSTLLVNIALAS